MSGVTSSQLNDLVAGGPARLLLVEDDASVLVSLQQELEEAGYQVITARNGAEALQVLAQQELPELILLDLMMPVMDGWQFLKTWRERDPASRVPVIALSAVSYRGAPGAAALVPKPIDMVRLMSVIQQIRPTPVSTPSGR